MPGDLAKGVDPVEGRLVQKLIAESCKQLLIKDEHDKIVSRLKVSAEGIAVLEINDLPDGGRAAWVRFLHTKKRFLYHPRFAMVECESKYWEGREAKYTHASAILIERGGDPSLYEEVRKQAEQKRQRAQQKRQRVQRQARLLDATFPIRVKWDGMAEALIGSLREIRSGSNGTLAIELPKTLGICTGAYAYTGHNVGTWNVTCPNALTASGTFQSGNGAHGEGTDNSGRTVTYTVDVGN